ncbi:N-carbamoylputrescine amidase [uncultured Sulfitobacter sp.]|uniref:N-carbamoylputrescine amidase n=1 Tax=uncultured Sulfitobacter sp. TaxID=191468 RepID=UPI00263910A3|nr:N-carbamoylputrescine amidase [uncultured Sulfitobacter sp.]
MREVTFAVTQFAADADRAHNLDTAEELVREAAGQGAQVILLQELFADPYFCKTQNPAHFDLAMSADEPNWLGRFAALAEELSVVLPISFFERSGQTYFNSVVVYDADGSDLGLYRKSHIPQGPGYEEKFYFSNGDSGFRVYETAYGCLGVGICWDQWFPEAARAMALLGAEVLLYPTAIGSEPDMPDHDSQPHWQTVMQGHAAANVMPVMASNRVGTEAQDNRSITFYGTSFIASETGQVIGQAAREGRGITLATIDLDKAAKLRRSWGVFRDRRVDLYGALTVLDGGV